MTAIIVDDDKTMLPIIREMLISHEEIRQCITFSDPRTALQYVKQCNSLDIAFLDVEMPDIDGIDLGTKLKELVSDISIVYLTSYNDRAVDAFCLDAISYIMKPPCKECVYEAIERIVKGRLPKGRKRFFAHTFGDFDFIADGKSVHFSNAKAKEFLAYLIDRQGAYVSVERAISILWEDRPCDCASSSLFRTVIADLKNTLHSVGADDILVDCRNQKCVDTSLFDCDFYAYLAHGVNSSHAFLGEYMLSYSWGEETLALINEHEKEKSCL